MNGRFWRRRSSLILAGLIVSSSMAQGQPEPTLVYPSPDQKPAYRVSGCATSANGGCTIVETFGFDRENSKRRPAQYSLLDLKSGAVRATRNLDAMATIGPLIITRDGLHLLGMVGKQRLLMQRARDGKAVFDVDMSRLGVDLPNLTRVQLAEDAKHVVATGLPKSSCLLALIELTQPPRLVASMDKGRFIGTSTFRTIGSQDDIRTAAVFIPKKHQQRGWTLELLDQNCQELASLDVPSSTKILDIAWPEYPLLLVAQGPRWKILSYDTGRLVGVRTGAHKVLQHPQSAILGGAISPDRKIVATSVVSPQCCIGIWSVSAGSLVRELPIAGAGHDLRFDSSGRYLSCSVQLAPSQWRLFVWDVASLSVNDRSGYPRLR
jgi:hypothetical protein